MGQLLRLANFSEPVSGCRHHRLEGAVHTTGSAGGFDCIALLKMSTRVYILLFYAVVAPPKRLENALFRGYFTNETFTEI